MLLKFSLRLQLFLHRNDPQFGIHNNAFECLTQLKSLNLWSAIWPSNDTNSNDKHALTIFLVNTVVPNNSAMPSYQILERLSNARSSSSQNGQEINNRPTEGTSHWRVTTICGNKICPSSPAPWVFPRYREANNSRAPHLCRLSDKQLKSLGAAELGQITFMKGLDASHNQIDTISFPCDVQVCSPPPSPSGGFPN